ncbi:hypothetical protein NQ317_016534, partial [Molorchus minor]
AETIDQRMSSAEHDYNSYLEPVMSESQFEEEFDDSEQSQDSFFQSFIQPLGHSRPFYYQQEGAYSQRSQPYQQVFDEPVRYSGYKEDEYDTPSSSSSSSSSSAPAAPAAPTHEDILGSGNFGVIRGGTFFNDNDGEQSSYGDFSSYFHNGHGRPSFSFGRPSNPKPHKHEQFANFKDFADINTPERQYSQYVVVYVNKNETEQAQTVTEGTRPSEKPVHKPKNIIESLAMLDLESSTAESAPEKKLSKSKRKLAQLLPEKKYNVQLVKKEKAQKDLNEPLLALS